MMRGAGILLAVSSLPSPHGIGCFSREAREFVDFLAEAGQSYWQLLPLGPTGYGDSPYQAFSAFAGNPYFIDVDALADEGLLTQEEIAQADPAQASGRVDYGHLYRERFSLLRRAAARSRFEEEEGYAAFRAQSADWLEDYALFMAIKNAMDGRAWTEWPDDIRMRRPQALEQWREKTREERRFFCFLQYVFTRQWEALKAYANERGVRIIGDIPIYVSPDSSDAWAHSELFQFDEDHRQTGCAGCPPDAFAPGGQLWGNPLYRWEVHEQTQFAWWKKRITHCMRLYDVLRIDHFRGFDAYYSIPAGDVDAKRGHWEQGPGMKLFEALRSDSALADCAIIAEDLGFLTDSVMQLVRDSGFPGMKVLEFAFDSRDTGSGYLPHAYTPNTVVYTGTHDNQTLAAWYDELSADDRRLADDYMGFDSSTTVEQRGDAFIRMAFESVSDTCVIPIQDYLHLGAEARMNRPSTLGGNWTWRLTPGQLTPALAQKIRRLTGITGRLYGRSERV